MNETPSAHLKACLLDVANQRSKAAFADLFKFFAPKIKQFGFKQFRNEAQALDLVQETMTSIWTKAHLFSPEKGAATTWVYTVMRNASFDMLRKIKTKREDNLSDDLWPLDDHAQTEEEVFRDHLFDDHMRDCVEQLPEAQRIVVKGVYFQELSQEQLARQLDIPLGTVKSRLRLALQKLKAQMGASHD